MCMYHFSVAVIKQRDHSEVCVCTAAAMDPCASWPAMVAASCRHGGGNRKLRAHILSGKQESRVSKMEAAGSFPLTDLL